ncbi:response regulator [Paenibacillus campi]|uniref:response regulator n=1 Tax=Paenibacillus campi TaxID=3106031 RepID=UPI002AFE0446|nr:response regulator [Paenibacillus sp. SGZ-1014]
MKQLLIVDDEKNIRQGLQVMIERQFPGRYMIRCARHGEEGLELLHHTPADIIITDIRMPVMDGMAMLERLRAGDELLQQPEVIVLSGHDDFEYAKVAIRYQVREYLLKPIRRDDLFAALGSLEQELLRKQSLSRRLEDADHYRRQWQQEQLSRWLEAPTDEAKRELASCTWLTLPQSYIVCVWNGVTADGQPVPVQELDLLLEQLADGEPDRYELQWLDRQGRRVWIITQAGLVRLQALAQAAARREVSGLWAGISDAAVDRTELQTAYGQACRALTYGFFCPGMYVLSEPLLQEDEEELSQSQLEDNVRRLGNLLGTGRSGEISDIVHQLFRLSGTSMRSLAAVRRTVRLINEGVLDEVFRHFGEASIEVLRLYRRVCSLEHYRYFHDYCRDLERLLLCLDDYIGQLRQVHSEHHRLKEAVAYLHRHYARPLNMATVSNHVSLNYSYFSEAFKAYTGESFVVYLKKLRIERAKELLVQSSYRLSEIGEQVGLENSRHFSRVFRELEGITPQEYRARLKLRSGMS